MKSLSVHKSSTATQHKQQPKQQAIIQPKLMVNAPGDKYEQEADAMADRVMRMQETSGVSTGMIGKSLEKKDKAIMPKSFTDDSGFEAPASITSYLMGQSVGSPLPQTTRSFMEGAFSRDFSSVRIHTDNTAAEMNEQIGAKAFTYGNDIFFGNGQYNIDTKENSKLIAHELTHVVQQEQGNKSIQRIIPLIIGAGVRYLGAKAISYGMDKIQDYIHTRNFENGKNTVFNLKGASEFIPSGNLLLYIDESLQQAPKVPVKVKFGDMAEGTINIFRDVAGGFSAYNQVIPFRHPQFSIDTSNNAMGLQLRIQNGHVSGKMGIVRGFSQAQFDSMSAMAGNFEGSDGFREEEMFYGILGEDYDKNELYIADYKNELEGGMLSLTFGGLLKIHGNQTMRIVFVLVNENLIWEGKMNLSVKGLEEKEMVIERDGKSNLYGLLPDINVASEWRSSKGFVKASLNATFNKGILDAKGEAEFETERLKGSINILIADEQTAWEAAANHVLLEGYVNAKADDLSAPSSNELAVTGWGSLTISLIKDGTDLTGKADKLTGEASFILDPDGFVTVSGKITCNRIFELIEEKKSAEKNLFKPEPWVLWIPVPWAAGGLKVSVSGGISAHTILGPVLLYDLSVEGTYSTNEKIPNSLSVSAKLNGSAALEGTASITGSVAARLGTRFKHLGVNVASASLSLFATGKLTGYFDAHPTIGLRGGGTGDKNTMPKFFIKGFVEVGGELDFAFGGEIEFSVLAAGWDKTIEFGKRSYRGFGLRVNMDYTFGDPISFAFNDRKSAAPFMLEFVKPNNVEREIVKSLLKEQKTRERDSFKGDVELGKDDKGKISPDEIEIPPSEPVDRSKITDSFEMDGETHTMELELGESGSDVLLLMESKKGLLLDKIQIERSGILAELAVSFDQDKKEQLQRRLTELESINAAAEKVIKISKKLGIDPDRRSKTKVPGFENLGDLIAIYSKRYGAKDLDGRLTPIPTPAKTLTKPTGDGKKDFKMILSGKLLELTGYENKIGIMLKLDPDYKSPKDKKGRTNRERTRTGLTPFLKNNDFVELHHRTQNFFSVLDEHSHHFHKSVLEDTEYHPYSNDRGYLSWRGEMAWHNGSLKRLGSIYDSIRKKHWRDRF